MDEDHLENNDIKRVAGGSRIADILEEISNPMLELGTGVSIPVGRRFGRVIC